MHNKGNTNCSLTDPEARAAASEGTEDAYRSACKDGANGDRSTIGRSLPADSLGNLRSIAAACQEDPRSFESQVIHVLDQHTDTELLVLSGLLLQAGAEDWSRIVTKYTHARSGGETEGADLWIAGWLFWRRLPYPDCFEPPFDGLAERYDPAFRARRSRAAEEDQDA